MIVKYSIKIGSGHCRLKCTFSLSCVISPAQPPDISITLLSPTLVLKPLPPVIAYIFPSYFTCLWYITSSPSLIVTCSNSTNRDTHPVVVSGQGCVDCRWVATVYEVWDIMQVGGYSLPGLGYHAGGWLQFIRSETSWGWLITVVQVWNIMGMVGYRFPGLWCHEGGWLQFTRSGMSSGWLVIVVRVVELFVQLVMICCDPWYFQNRW